MPRPPSRTPRGGGRTGPRNPRRAETPVAAGWASRVAAGELLLLVANDNADLDSALSQSASYAALAPSDRAFARAIASAALRARGRIDWALGGLVDRPLEQIEPPLLALLRAGAAQLWLMGAPDYAVVSATVEAARRWPPARRGGGLVNAVLRRAGREPALFREAPPTSIWPDWLAARMKAALGADRADRLARLQLDEPALDLTLKRPADAEDWALRLGGDALPGGTVRLKSGVRIQELEGYDAGEWWIQDAGAALAARVLAPQRGETVIDLCAAPGGKALQLAAAGAEVTALDISMQRLVSLRENVARVGAEMTVLAADALVWRPERAADAILLDAPCSAMGVLRRHPEAAWSRDPGSFGRYPARQAALLEAAHAMLKPGGRLVYCVCTPFPEEGEAVIDRGVASGLWRPLEIAAHEVPGFAYGLTQGGYLLTAPHPEADLDSEYVNQRARESEAQATSSDVFFIARLAKAR